MKIQSPISKRKARIEIIPLIDIIFFLLATFVMVSLSMVQNQGVNVNLPTAATSTSEDRNRQTTLTITEQGEYYLNKEAMSLGQISTALMKLKRQHADLKVLINGDEKAFFGKAIALLDETRKLGIAKVSIQTKRSAHP